MLTSSCYCSSCAKMFCFGECQVKSLRDIAQSAMFSLIEQQHGGCEEEDCGIAQKLRDNDQEEAIISWHMSGAACDKFNKISARFLEVK